MEEIKKRRRPGRPTEKRMDAVLRLRVDAKTHEILKDYARKRQVSMSELMREAISMIVEQDKEHDSAKSDDVEKDVENT